MQMTKTVVYTHCLVSMTKVKKKRLQYDYSLFLYVCSRIYTDVDNTL